MTIMVDNKDGRKAQTETAADVRKMPAAGNITVRQPRDVYVKNIYRRGSIPATLIESGDTAELSYTMPGGSARNGKIVNIDGEGQWIVRGRRSGTLSKDVTILQIERVADAD
ncbi:MAG: hypothetical protein WA908_01400 [Pontixanthobacter sp.]